MGTYLVMKNNVKRCFHHKLLFAVTFFIPLILCIAFGMIRFGKTTVRAGILMNQENANSEMKGDLFRLLDQSSGIKYENADARSVNTDLMTGKYHIILDYRESNAIDHFKLLSYQKEEKTQFMERCFKEAMVKKQPVILSGMKKKGLTVTQRSLASLLTLFMIFTTIFAAAMIKDRQNGMINRYRLAKQSGMGYMTGYLAYLFLITFVQVLLCMSALMLVQKEFALGVTKAFVLALLITAISAVFSMLVCLISKNEVQANIMASSVAAVMSLMGGTFVAVSSMPGLLRILSFVSPVRWLLFLIK